MLGNAELPSLGLWFAASRALFFISRVGLGLREKDCGHRAAVRKEVGGCGGNLAGSGCFGGPKLDLYLKPSSGCFSKWWTIERETMGNQKESNHFRGSCVLRCRMKRSSFCAGSCVPWVSLENLAASRRFGAIRYESSASGARAPGRPTESRVIYTQPDTNAAATQWTSLTGFFDDPWDSSRET